MVDTIMDGSISAAAAYATAFLFGVGLHLGLFRFGEWDGLSFVILSWFATAPVALAAPLWLYDGAAVDAGEILKALGNASRLVAVAVVGLWTSMLVYRAFFHRLCRFRGPYAARLSNLYMTAVYVVGRHPFRMYREIQDLHRKYGDIVRVGPTELSIADPQAFSAIYSATSPCTRGPWYNILWPHVSLQMVRDTKEHSRRRKAWDKAFSVTAMRDYQGRLNKYTSDLLSAIDTKARNGEATNVSKWFHFYTWDVMGDLSFGHSFDMLRDGVEHYFFTTTHLNMVLIGMFSRVAWLMPIFRWTPGANYQYLRFLSRMKGEVHKRIDNQPAVNDVFHWILADYHSKPTPLTWQERQNLYGDASLIVVAGSDTTAATLACLFFNLARHPDTYRKLQAEVDEYLVSKSQSENGKTDRATAAAAALAQLDNYELGRLTFLQACIDESLRLFPPVPSGLQRQTPPEGLRVGDTFIPGDTIVQMPTYTLYRDPRVFTQGDEFIPERWTTRPELVKMGSVFAPFSVGRFSCVGKQLALMEVRRTAVFLASRYSVALAADQKAEDYEEKLMDVFTLALPDLRLAFTLRK